MKKIMLSVIAMAIALPSFAQWANVGSNETTTNSVGIGTTNPQSSLLSVGDGTQNPVAKIVTEPLKQQQEQINQLNKKMDLIFKSIEN